MFRALLLCCALASVSAFRTTGSSFRADSLRPRRGKRGGGQTRAGRATRDVSKGTQKSKGGEVHVAIHLHDSRRELISPPFLVRLGPKTTKAKLEEIIRNDEDFAATDPPEDSRLRIEYQSNSSSMPIKIQDDVALQYAYKFFRTEADAENRKIDVYVIVRESSGFKKLDKGLQELLTNKFHASEANLAADKLFEDGITTVEDLALIDKIDEDSLPALYESKLGSKLEGNLVKARAQEIKKQADVEQDQDVQHIQKLKEVQTEFDEILNLTEELRELAANKASDENENISAIARQKMNELKQKLEPFNVHSDLEFTSNMSWTDAEAFVGKLRADLTKATEVFNKPELSIMELIHKNNILHGILLTSKVVFGEGHLTVRGNAAVRLQKGVDPKEFLRHSVMQEAKSFRSQSESEQSMKSAKIIVQDAGSSFASNVWGQSAGISFGSLGAYSTAVSMAKAKLEAETSKERKSTKSKQTHYLEVHSQPEASIIIEKNKLSLTKSAIKKLRKVAKQTDKNERAKELHEFFDDYGSHVCAKVTLGGQMTIEGSVTSEINADQEEVENAISEATSGQGSHSYFSITRLKGLALGKGSTAHDYKDDTSSGAKAGRTSVSQTQKSVAETSYKGGQPGLPTHMWRQSLSKNSNWKIIDLHLKDCIPLWQLVEDSRKDFKGSLLNSIQLKDEMFQLWYTSMLGLKTDGDGKLPRNLTSREQLEDWMQHNYKAFGECANKSWCNAPHGTCDTLTGECECEDHWGGNACESHIVTDEDFFEMHFLFNTGSNNETRQDQSTVVSGRYDVHPYPGGIDSRRRRQDVAIGRDAPAVLRACRIPDGKRNEFRIALCEIASSEKAHEVHGRFIYSGRNSGTGLTIKDDQGTREVWELTPSHYNKEIFVYNKDMQTYMNAIRRDSELYLHNYYQNDVSMDWRFCKANNYCAAVMLKKISDTDPRLKERGWCTCD